MKVAFIISSLVFLFLSFFTVTTISDFGLHFLDGWFAFYFWLVHFYSLLLAPLILISLLSMCLGWKPSHNTIKLGFNLVIIAFFTLTSIVTWIMLSLYFMDIS